MTETFIIGQIQKKPSKNLMFGPLLTPFGANVLFSKNLTIMHTTITGRNYWVPVKDKGPIPRKLLDERTDKP